MPTDTHDPTLGRPTAPDLSADKAALRTQLLACRAAVRGEARAAAEAAILAHLTALPVWKKASVVVGYASIRGEIDMDPLWRAAALAHKTYALPVTVRMSAPPHAAVERGMIFRATPGYCPEALIPGRYGIAEPPDIPAFPPLAPDALRGALVIVPGLGFDDAGYRIGYGGGYYDRALSLLAEAGIPVSTVGLVFSACRCPALPRERHDRAVDIIIDERSVCFL